MPEYLSYRCCMCPNSREPERSNICPGGPFQPLPSLCRFVKRYIDARGWKYRVMSGISGNTFKARYQKPEKHGEDGWHCVKALPWRDSFDEAQGDLNKYAEQKGWGEWDG